MNAAIIGLRRCAKKVKDIPHDENLDAVLAWLEARLGEVQSLLKER
jgi:hypothetical protein